MMPPHLTQAPVLTGDTLVLEGYTLDISNPAEELRVVDVETGEALAFDAEVSSVTEDRSGGTPDPPPGSIQSRCTSWNRCIVSCTSPSPTESAQNIGPPR